jgi:hypothetical protein
VFNDVLTFDIPSEFDQNESGYVREIGGYIDSSYFGFQFYDTTFQSVKNENEFQISLIGFISGRTEDPALKNYDVTVVDTLLNGKQGLMAFYISANSLEAYKKVSYFVTLANNHFYWFYVYSTRLGTSEDEVHFFRSIKFEKEKLVEKSFKLTPVRLTKKAN